MTTLLTANSSVYPDVYNKINEIVSTYANNSGVISNTYVQATFAKRINGVVDNLLVNSTTPSSANSVVSKAWVGSNYTSNTYSQATFLKTVNAVASGLLVNSTTPSSANSVVSKAWVGSNYTSNTYVQANYTSNTYSQATFAKRINGVVDNLLVNSTTPSSANSVVSKAWVGSNYTSNTYSQATFLKISSNPVIVTSISIGTGSANTVINSGGIYGGNQTLTDGATINWNGDLGHIGTVTLGGNRTFANMTNPRVGYYLLHIIQDGTGSRTLSWGSIYKWPGGVAPVLTTTASARDLITFICDGTNMYGTYVNDVK